MNFKKAVKTMYMDKNC